MVFNSGQGRDTASASLLCVACGIADAVGFLHSGVFAANMTGNTVLAALALAEQHWALALERLMALFMFFSGAMVARLLLLRTNQKVWLPLLLECVLLCVSAFMDPRHAHAIWVIAAAMGVQAASIVKFRSAAVSTVVVTSTMVRLAEASVDKLSNTPHAAGASTRSPTDLLVLTWVSYGVGAALAVPFMHLTPWPLLVPAGVLLFLCSIWLKDADTVYPAKDRNF